MPLLPVEPGLLDPVPPLGLLRFPGLFWLPDLLEPPALPDLLEELPELPEPLMPPRLLLLRSSPRESRPALPLSLAIHPPALFGTCLLLSTKQFGVILRAREKGKLHAIFHRGWRPQISDFPAFEIGHNELSGGRDR